jgi:hypothetical protein
VLDIFKLKDQGQPYRQGAAIGRQYGVTAKTIRDIWSGRTWSDLTSKLSGDVGTPKLATRRKETTQEASRLDNQIDQISAENQIDRSSTQHDSLIESVGRGRRYRGKRSLMSFADASPCSLHIWVPLLRSTSPQGYQAHNDVVAQVQALLDALPESLIELIADSLALIREKRSQAGPDRNVQNERSIDTRALSAGLQCLHGRSISLPETTIPGLITGCFRIFTDMQVTSKEVQSKTRRRLYAEFVAQDADQDYARCPTIACTNEMPKSSHTLPMCSADLLRLLLHQILRACSMESAKHNVHRTSSAMKRGSTDDIFLRLSLGEERTLGALVAWSTSPEVRHKRDQV